MAGLDFANFDFDAVAEEACGPNATWDGSQCVPNAPPPKPAILGPGGEQLRVDRFGRAQGMGTDFDPHDLGGGLSDAAYYPGFDDATSAPIPPWTGGEAAKTLLGASAFTGEADLDELIRSVNLQSSYDILNDPNWAGNRPTMNQPVLNTSTGEMISGKDAIARLQDPLSQGNWTPEEWAAGQAFLTSLGGNGAAPAAPATTGAATTTPAAVDWYEQQGIVSPGISDAEQAWLDAAIAGGTFTGDLGQVPAEQVLGNVGGADLGGATLDDPRIQMRIDLAKSLLEQGHTVADIEQFMGMESLLTDEGLGTVAGERLDSFQGVGSDQWFDFLESPAGGGLTVLDEHRSTLPWVDSPEFKEKYGSIDDSVTETLQCREGEHEENGVCVPNTPGLVCGEGEHEENGVCVPDTVTDPSGCPSGQTRNASGQCVPIEQIAEADACPTGQMRDASGQCVDIPPPGVPVYVKEQVDAINIVRNQLKDIKDAHAKLLKSGLANIDGVEQALTDAESDIYAKQYGVLGPDGEVLTPGEMDRLLSTWDARRATSKKNRTIDREEILAIMTDEGVPAGLAQSELDMIQAIHGDSIDAQYDYIDSLWRIGKMSHDERTSMIGNMMASYRLQLRDTVIEMLMGEEISAAEEIGDIRQTALQADTMANLFEGMTENEVFALMSSGMSDLLQLPEDDAIGMISDGEWAGYTSGQKANVLITAGYTQNADGTFSPPAADADPTGMITTGEWAGYTEADKSAAYLRAGYTQDAAGKWVAAPDAVTDADGGLKVPIPLGTLSELGMTAEAAREAGYTLSNIQYDPAQPGRILDANVTAMGTSTDYGTIVGEQRLGEASDLAYTGLITEGEYAGMTQGQKTIALANNEDPTGMITTGDWAGVTYGDKARALNAQGIDPATGNPYDDVANEDKKYRMNASELTDRGLFLEDFEVFGGSTDGGRTGVPEFVMISVEEFADLTGEYMFPASPDADPEWMTALFPSGVKTADVPGLPFDDKNGEYQMNAEALAVFGPLQEAVNAERAETAATFAGKTIVDILQESGHGMYSRTQQAVNTLMSKNMRGTTTKWRDAGLSETALWLYTVEQAASHDVEYAQVWANYTGVNAIVNAVTDTSGRVTTPAQTISPDPEYIR